MTRRDKDKGMVEEMAVMKKGKIRIKLRKESGRKLGEGRGEQTDGWVRQAGSRERLNQCERQGKVEGKVRGRLRRRETAKADRKKTHTCRGRERADDSHKSFPIRYSHLDYYTSKGISIKP